MGTYTKTYELTDTGRVSYKFQDGELESVTISSRVTGETYFEVWGDTRYGWLKAARQWEADGVRPDIENLRN